MPPDADVRFHHRLRTRATRTLPAIAGLGLLALAACEPRSPGAAESGPPPRTRDDTAMGTVVEIKTYARDPAAADAAMAAAVAELHRIEALTTPHDPDSELSRLGAAAGRSPVAVGPELDAMLRLGRAVAEASGGAFDPTMGPLIHAWGFPYAPHVPRPAVIDSARALVDWRELEPLPDGAADGGPSRGAAAWRLARPGMAVDLGGLAKGWAVDAAADLAAAAGGNCLVNVGGDLAVRGTKPGGRPWVIGVQDPRDPSKLFRTLRLAGDLAVATSGDYQRYVEVDGVRYHHLLDPATGAPGRRANSATVIAPTCALADAWATAAFVLGPGTAIPLLEALPRVEAIVAVVLPDGGLDVHETSGVASIRVE